MQEAELSFQAVVDPYARPISSSPWADEVALEEGFITFPTLPGGFLTKVGRCATPSQGERTAPAHAPVGRSALVATNLTGGEDGLADAGSPSRASSRTRGSSWRRPARSIRATPRSSRRPRAPTRLRRPPARVPGPRRIDQHRPGRLGRLRPQRRHRRHDDAPLGVDGTLRWKPLRRSIYTHFLARGEVTWSRWARRMPRRARRWLRVPRVPVRPR